MGYQALYRSWRPQNFKDIIGQEHIVTSLTNALKIGRLAHAYLFSGPRGTGKTSTAKVLAKALNCLQADSPSPEPCNECANCREITVGSSLDVIEIDAASNRGIDEIRDLREKAKFSPANSRYKVYIIDEVHMLTTEAFNALLKTLEEPPAHVVFILATTDPQKIPLTVLSRCQRYDFHRLPGEELMNHLAKICKAIGVKADETSLNVIAKSSEGCVRDALSLLDQVISYCGQSLNPQDTAKVLGIATDEAYFQMADLILTRRLADAILFIDQLLLAGKDLYQFTQGLIWHFRNLLLLLTCGEVGKEQLLAKDRALEQAKRFGRSGLLKMIKFLSETLSEMKYSSQPRINLEIALVQITTGEKPSSSFKIAEVESGSNDYKVQAEEKTPLNKENLNRENKEEKVSPPVSFTDNFNPPAAGKEVKESKPKEGKELNLKKENLNSDLDQIQRNWKKVLDIIVKKRPGLANVLKKGRLLSFKNNCLTIGFGFGFSGYSLLLNDPKNKQLICQVLHDIMGITVQVACTEIPESEEAILEKTYLTEIDQLSKDPSQEKEEDNDPLVAGLLTMFSGEIVSEGE